MALAVAVAYLAIMPLMPLAASAHDAGRLLQLAVLAVAALLTLFYVEARNTSLPDEVKFCAMGCLLLFVPSVIAASDRIAAAQEVALILGLAGLALQACYALRSGSITWVYVGLLGGCGAHLLLITGVYAAALVDGGPLDARQLHIGFDNPRFFNHVQTLVVPVLLGWSVAASSRLQRHTALTVASLQFAWLFMDLARASLLSLAVATLWFGWVGAASLWRRLLLCLAGGAAIYATLFVGLPAVLGRSWSGQFADVQELSNAHSRELLWGAALELIQAHPWLGSGPMHFAALAHPKGAHPHNLYLQWAAELGLPSLLLLLLLFVSPLWRASAALRQTPRNSSPMTAALSAALLAALVDAVFSGNFVMPISQVCIAVVYGLLLASLPSTRRILNPWLSRPVLALLLASQIWLCMQAWQQWHYDPPRVSASSPVAAAEQKPRPRFWRYGWL